MGAFNYATVMDRFYTKVERIPIAGCWIWTAQVDKDGYGLFRGRDKPYRAHRFSFMAHKGDIPDGLFVLHRCDVPGCVNPDHLFLGTNRDNVLDMISKGRDTRMKAERSLTHCKHGHQFDEENTRWKGNKRVCRQCNRDRVNRIYWARKQHGRV